MHRRFDEGPEEAAAIVNEALLTFLQDWLKHHILIEDMAYRPHAERSPAARDAAKSFKATEVWWRAARIRLVEAQPPRIPPDPAKLLTRR